MKNICMISENSCLLFLYSGPIYGSPSLCWSGMLISRKKQFISNHVLKEGIYSGIFWLMFIINFVAPILILMSRDAKRNYTTITFMSILILFGHWLDFFQMVFPSPSPEHVPMILYDLGIALGFFGLIMFVTGRTMAKWPMLAKNHPFIKESVIHHT